jgi:hypothetical protein
MIWRYFATALCLAFLTFTLVGIARAGYFTDVSAMAPLNYYGALPCGVNSSGAVSLQGESSAHTTSLYQPYVYTGGSNPMVSDIFPLFSSYTSITYGCPMNAGGQMAVVGVGGGYGYLYSGGTNGTVTAYQNGTYNTMSLAINNAGMEGGYFVSSAATAPWFPYVYAGGSVYPLNRPATDVYSEYGAGIVALNASGQAVGFSTPYALPLASAAVWTYTISGGSVASQTATDVGSQVTAQFPTAESSTLLAINGSGNAVGQWSASWTTSIALGNESGAFLYNVNHSTVTSLGSLLVGLKNGENFNWGSGLDQCINDSGEVVGCIVNTANTGGGGTNTLSGYDAAIWKNGSVTDLNTLYAPALAGTGFTLDNATAIDDDGDIAGYGHDANGNVEQAFLLQALLPGDSNEDGRVDVNDLTVVLTNFGQTGMTWSQGEFTGDGKVDVNDLTIVLANFGKGSGSSGSYLSPVPEPSSLALFALGAIVLLGCAGRRRKEGSA